jgi:tetratricopeptide (TPR) repeat protein
MPVSRNRCKNKKKSTKATKSDADKRSLPPLPDPRVVEGLMAQISGRDAEDALGQAQEMIYDAWDAGQKRDRIALAKQALKISPLCADAYVLLAEEASNDLLEARDYFAKGVEAGKLALGAETFEKDAGHFWGILETRPYMRARAGLAEVLWELGERDRVVAHYRDMLRLNPNDNQGIRHILASCLLVLDDLDALETLVREYADDAFAEWAYTKVLIAFRREGASQTARNELEAAWQSNAYVPDYLLQSKRLPAKLPAHFALGSKDEAVVYVVHNRDPWRATPGALEWLAATVGDLPPGSRG